MRQWKKVLLAILAAGAMVLAGLGLAGAFADSWFPQPEETVQTPMSAYPHPVETTSPPTEETQPPTEETVPPVTEPPIPRTDYETVPQFFMTDYPDIRYRTGTLATSGSNIAALSMVASYLTGYEYLPDELADYFANYIGNTMQWLEHASTQLQLPWSKAENFHVARQALQEGKIVIALMGDRSVFTNGQHYLVLTGINDQGKIQVNDPMAEHYSLWNLKEGLANGFGDNAIITGYLGSWIYDPAAIPEEPFYYEPAENTDEYRYPGLYLTQDEQDLMAAVLCMEAESEPFEGQQAIAEVILNRLAAGNFPNSINDIVYAENQFLSADRLYLAKPTHVQYEAIRRAQYGPYVLEKDVVFFSTGPVNDNVWGTIGSHTFCHQW